jgi:hypothetical protein
VLTGDRNSHRRVCYAGGRGLLALAAVAGAAWPLGGCGASSSVDPVARAADTTTREPGAQLAFTERISSPALGQPLTVTGTGYVNERQRSGFLTMRLGQFPGGAQIASQNIDMQFHFPVLYMRSAAFSKVLPGGKAWVAIDMQKAAQDAGVSSSALTNTGFDPSQYLSYLRASSGSLTKLGSAVVAGVPTTGYKATIQLSRVVRSVPAAQRASAEAGVAQLERRIGVSSFPIKVWIDSKHRVRREQLDLITRPQGGAGPVTTTVIFDYLSFGPTPDVMAPPPSQTFDATGQLASGLKNTTGK